MQFTQYELGIGFTMYRIRYTTYDFCVAGLIAQVVERTPDKGKVPGSSPGGPTMGM